MSREPQLVSPKQAARAIGVSESSLKRWCDRGDLETVRTAGGHRKIAVAEVLRFARERHQALAAPELLGLPSCSIHAEIGLKRGGSRMAAALLEGDEPVARQVIFDLYLARHALCEIFDRVVAAAFHEIGDRWACREADVYQERRACQIALRILAELRKLVPPPRLKGWLAIGGTIEGDPYALPTAMAELVLRDCGFQATSLGPSIPVASLIAAVHQLRPKLFWLSVSYLGDGLDFVARFAELSKACTAAGAALVVGGQALTEDLRQQMAYAAYGDTMQHLQGFAKALHRSSGSGTHPAPRVAKGASKSTAPDAPKPGGSHVR
ncbi:MAG TPA: helix-turn-helix domain-containing protein [Pirellulales bacterium]|nr:helix-turn-helix domain-containing protein [Pirellulales bacterium]